MGKIMSEPLPFILDINQEIPNTTYAEREAMYREQKMAYAMRKEDERLNAPGFIDYVLNGFDACRNTLQRLRSHRHNGK